MKVEQREEAIVLVPESEFEKGALRLLRTHSVKNMDWEDAWDENGKFIITFDNDWGR